MLDFVREYLVSSCATDIVDKVVEENESPGEVVGPSVEDLIDRIIASSNSLPLEPESEQKIGSSLYAPMILESEAEKDKDEDVEVLEKIVVLCGGTEVENEVNMNHPNIAHLKAVIHGILQSSKPLNKHTLYAAANKEEVKEVLGLFGYDTTRASKVIMQLCVMLLAST